MLVTGIATGKAIRRMNQEDRKDPETLIGRGPESKKGRLKVYLGGAAGVGKTYRMLEEAHQLLEQGHDVVLGFVETHGRAETAARIGKLEAVPLRTITYRSVILEEMDVDAVLARKPEFAVVDEVAHTNALGSRHNKRYQDVEELVGSGINVIAALNVQHLESLNQMVRRITGVEIRETVPDTFLAHADQVLTVDISVAGLRHRLREGKIYPPEQVEQALKNFFKPGNLAALRELALREVARDQSWKREELELLKREGGRRLAVTEQLMVCLSSNREGGQELLRKAGRIAAQLNADWYAVHVETPAESIQKTSGADFGNLLDNIKLAADMGAEIAWLKSPDVIKALIEFARDKAITLIVVGQAQPRFWNRILRRSLTSRLLAEGRDFNIEVVAQEGVMSTKS
jgi:two-component system sensor histidine kinase KdpD